MSFETKLDGILAKFDELQKSVSGETEFAPQEYVKSMKEISRMEKLVGIIREYKTAKSDLADAEGMVKEPDMKAFAEEEIGRIKSELPGIEERLKIALLPKDEADEKNAILEVRAGAGGDEAALFAAEIFRAYARYAEARGWKFEIMSLSEVGLGGYKEASATITGTDVFARMKFESGVHRVQRVPKTEAGGRVHTSTCTVAVLPEAEEVDIKIFDKDLRIDVYRSSGPGGQSVNTTDSAVRITHIPTGVVVAIQDEKSQIKNKEKAMKILRSRIYEAERQRKEAEYAAARKDQVGTGDRSERIRTYNFPQSRVTDHRINMNTQDIGGFMDGGKPMDQFIEALIQHDQAEKLLAAAG